jgi:FlaA1/EpsC-like NDP-sugar epimerase
MLQAGQAKDGTSRLRGDWGTVNLWGRHRRFGDEKTGNRSYVAHALAKVRADIGFAFVDAVLVIAGYVLALGLRSFDPVDGLSSDSWPRLLRFLPVVLVVYLLFSIALGAYGHVWEYASVSEAQRVAIGVFCATATLFFGTSGLALITGQQAPIPRSVIIMGGLLALVGMGIVRFRSRLFSLNRLRHQPYRERTLVVGTGTSAWALARTAMAHSSLDIVGFVGVHSAATVRRMAGLPIYGPLEDLPNLVERLEVARVVLAGGEREGLARTVVDLCMEADVHLSLMPDVTSITGAQAGVRDIRDLALDDLLVRPRVTTDLSEVGHLLKGGRVLVTGAGGSIGSELVHQIIGFHPEAVIALDHDETHLHQAGLAWPNDVMVAPLLCDIRDRSRLRRAFEEYQPTVVFHAAAHKHVPILQEHPDEAIKTNILGTVNVLDAAEEASDLSLFVLISTDKAVDPAGAMGASKRMAEMVVQARAAQMNGCKYTAVRFGNVLGSRGSVVPTFISQVASGGPVTVTNPDMTRYFMTISEAVQLVLQAAALAEGGEVFVLDMGEPVRIDDLARRLIRLAGLVPGRDINVIYTGVRPGEKMVEVLSKRPLESSAHPKIHVARPDYPGPATILDLIEVLRRDVDSRPNADLYDLLMGVTRGGWDNREVIDLTEMSDAAQEQGMQTGLRGAG